MRKLSFSGIALGVLPFAAAAADLPARTAPPEPAPIPVASVAHSWTGFYGGINAGRLRTRNGNQLQYRATDPNELLFNTRNRGFTGTDPAVRSLSTPTLGSLLGPLPLFATALAPTDYYSTFASTDDQPNRSAQINDRSLAANQASLDEAVAIGTLPDSLVGNQRDRFTGGAALGYNYQVNSLVFGIEADFSYLGRGGDAAFASGAPVVVGVNPLPISVGGGNYIISNSLIEAEGNNEARWLATVRGRFGFAVDRALIYATGGLAIGRVKSSVNISVSDSFLGVPLVDATWAGTYSRTRVGWALGAGFQYAISGNWSVKAEYLHYDLGRHSYAVNSTNPDNVLPYDSGDYAVSIRARARTTGDMVRVGLNYRF